MYSTKNYRTLRHICLGLAIIDFEHWRPMFEENFGSLLPYKEYAMEIEKYNHPFWDKENLQKEVINKKIHLLILK